MRVLLKSVLGAVAIGATVAVSSTGAVAAPRVATPAVVAGVTDGVTVEPVRYWGRRRYGYWRYRRGYRYRRWGYRNGWRQPYGYYRWRRPYRTYGWRRPYGYYPYYGRRYYGRRYYGPGYYGPDGRYVLYRFLTVLPYVLYAR